MLNCSPRLWRHELMNDLLLACGLTGKDIEFLYIPIDGKTSQCLGYAHISLRSAAVCERVAYTLHGGQFERYCTNKVICVEPSRLQVRFLGYTQMTLNPDSVQEITFLLRGCNSPLYTQSCF